MSFLDPLSFYLGVDFFYNPFGILFSHSRYIHRYLIDLGLTNCLPSPIPMDLVKFPSCLSIWILLFFLFLLFYHCGVGKLLHVTLSRPNISFVVGVVTRFTTTPCKAHLDAMLQVFQYLKATLALHYQRGGDITPVGYANNDFMGEKDEYQSTTSYLMSVGSVMEEHLPEQSLPIKLRGRVLCSSRSHKRSHVVPQYF